MKNLKTANMFSMIASAVLIAGCFLPWVQIGIFSSKGTDNADGSILLVLGIICGIISYVNYSRNDFSYIWAHFLTGAYALYKGIEHSDSTALRVPNSFIGAGVYIVVLGAISLIVAAFWLDSVNEQPIEAE